MKKKIMAVLLATTMAVGMLAGCGGSKGGESASSNLVEQNAEDKDLVVWCWDPAFNIFSMEEAAKIYTAEHSDVTITVEEVPWQDIQTRLSTAATSGDLTTLPDIFLMQDNAFQKNVMAYGNAIYDITGSGIDFSKFAAGKTAYSVVNGKNYGVPFDNGAVVACYRTDLLAEAGLTIADFTDITWAQYIENGKKVKEATGKALLSMQAGECDLLMMMMQSAGASIFNEDGTANMVNNDTLKVVMEQYATLKKEGVLVEVNSWDEYVASIVNGDVAGTINGCWIMASIQTAADQSGNWALTNMPKLEGVANATNYSNNGGSSWAITTNCSNVALASDFLAKTFAGSTDFYDNILSCGAIATWAPAGESSAYGVPSDFFSGDAVFAKIVEFSTHVPSNVTGPYYYEGRDAIATALTNYVNGGDLASELATAESTVNANVQ